MKVDDVLRMSFPTPKWVVENFLTRGAVSVLWGSQGIGKTFFVMDMSVLVAKGQPFIGLPTFRGPVLYYCPDRIDAQKQAGRIRTLFGEVVGRAEVTAIGTAPRSHGAAAPGARTRVPQAGSGGELPAIEFHAGREKKIADERIIYD